MFVGYVISVLNKLNIFSQFVSLVGKVGFVNIKLLFEFWLLPEQNLLFSIWLSV